MGVVFVALINVLVTNSATPQAFFPDIEKSWVGGVSVSKFNTKNPKTLAVVASAVKTLPLSNLDFTEEGIGTENPIAITNNSYLIKPSISTTVVSSKKLGSKIVIYVVQGGDTVSSIAKKFRITTLTIKWANKLKDIDSLKPGQKLIILPTSGVLHTVKSGETLDEIAQHYGVRLNKIITQNNLKNNVIRIGQKLIIPGGKIKETPTPRRLASSYSSTRRVPYYYPRGRNHFPYGYCTYYVATKRYVPWSGNAGAWLYNSRYYGYSTGYVPRTGAIVVTTESWVGHVAYVEAVKGNYITISEMNGPAGWGRVGWRTIPAYGGVVRGYIY